MGSVKQEIAKEGILPGSLFFSRSITTPWGLIRKRLGKHFWPEEDYEPEQSPTPALLLHWIFSMILIGATSARAPVIAYQILVSLYAYTIVIMLGFFTAAGLLYARSFCEKGEWIQRSGFKPWGGPTAAVIYWAICAFLLAASFVPPKEGSPFLTQVKWFVIPTVGLSFLVLGYMYYVGLTYVVPPLFKKKKMLYVHREAIIVREKGEYVQHCEIVDHGWEAGDEEDIELRRVTVASR